jgi:CRISPR type III-B/RAMP module RAMP protein Cmr1
MKTQTYTLEVITPCFCAGADQPRAEIRAPSIRGELRWWFRALGGSAIQEAEVFGGVHDVAKGSKVLVRVSDFKQAAEWNPPQRLNPFQDPSAYIWYYASASGKKQGAAGHGPRWTSKGCVPPGSTFQMQVKVIRPLTEDLRRRFVDALDCFLHLGSLGLRMTRGLGAFACHERRWTEDSQAKIEAILAEAGFGFHMVEGSAGQWQQAVEQSALTLRELRKNHPAGKNGDIPSPLGSSRPRQTSAVRLRPIRIGKDQYKLVKFEAPANRVLGQPSSIGAPVLR